MRRIRQALVPALVAWLCLSLGPGITEAHPMGNFSINHYVALTFAGDRVQLVYLIDMAEIPTFQELTGLQASFGIADLAGNPARRLSATMRAGYLAGKARALAANLLVRVDGRPLPLHLDATDLAFPPGAGGLPTERIYLALDARLPPGARHALTYVDENFPDRAGWKEIVGQPAAGARLDWASVPPHDRSRALTVYPLGAISSPPQDLSASFTVLPGPSLPSFSGRTWGVAALGAIEHGLVGADAAPISPDTRSWMQQRVDALTTLIASKNITAEVLLLSLLAAFGLGSVHALSPGHGKTMVAAYLVGSRGTSRQALLLGLTVTITHTAGVFALGLVTLLASQYIVPDKLYPWLGCISGLLIAAMGTGITARRMARWRAETPRAVPASRSQMRSNEEPHHVPVRA